MQYPADASSSRFAADPQPGSSVGQFSSSSGAGPESGPIPIVVDDREVGGAVCDLLRTRREFTVEVRRLSVGDYLVGSGLCVERKTVRDFIASIIDGRLFQQAARLAASSDPVCLILEGSGRDIASTGMTREAIQGALISLGLIFHLPVLRSVNAEETVRLMVHASMQLSRQQHDEVSRGGSRPKRRRRAQLLALQGLPRVGPKRAIQLLDHFGSVRGVVTARPDELRKLPGISDKTIEAIEWVLG